MGSGEDPFEIDLMAGKQGMLCREENQRTQEQEGLLEVGQRTQGMAVGCQHRAQRMSRECLPFLSNHRAQLQSYVDALGLGTLDVEKMMVSLVVCCLPLPFRCDGSIGRTPILRSTQRQRTGDTPPALS